MDSPRNEKKIHALCLTGTPTEMGRAFGQFTKDQKALDTIYYYSQFIERVLSFQPMHRFDRWLRKEITSLLLPHLRKASQDRIPARHLEFIRGFAEGSEVPLPELIQGYTMPDVYA